MSDSWDGHPAPPPSPNGTACRHAECTASLTCCTLLPQARWSTFSKEPARTPSLLTCTSCPLLPACPPPACLIWSKVYGPSLPHLLRTPGPGPATSCLLIIQPPPAYSWSSHLLLTHNPYPCPCLPARLPAPSLQLACLLLTNKPHRPCLLTNKLPSSPAY